MAYNVELSESAERELGKLDASQAKRILKFLHQRVAKLDDPRSIGEALHGSRLGEFWKYRVGDYRLICKTRDAQSTQAIFAFAIGTLQHSGKGSLLGYFVKSMIICVSASTGMPFSMCGW